MVVNHLLMFCLLMFCLLFKIENKFFSTLMTLVFSIQKSNCVAMGSLLCFGSVFQMILDQQLNVFFILHFYS